MLTTRPFRSGLEVLVDLGRPPVGRSLTRHSQAVVRSMSSGRPTSASTLPMTAIVNLSGGSFEGGQAELQVRLSSGEISLLFAWNFFLLPRLIISSFVAGFLCWTLFRFFSFTLQYKVP